MNRSKIIGWLLALIVLALIIAALFSDGPEFGVYATQLAQQLEAFGAAGVLLFILINALSTAMGLPRQFFAFVAGFSYGVLAGVLLSSVGAIAGCAITFSLSRRWFKQRVTIKWPDHVAWLNKLLDKDAFLKILVLRFQPLGTNFLTNLCAGVTSIKMPVFLKASWLGYLPQLLVFALVGSGIRVGSTFQLYISLLLFVVSLVIAWILYKRHKLTDSLD